MSAGLDGYTTDSRRNWTSSHQRKRSSLSRQKRWIKGLSGTTAMLTKEEQSYDLANMNSKEDMTSLVFSFVDPMEEETKSVTQGRHEVLYFHLLTP
jgi:hypothetical protein